MLITENQLDEWARGNARDAQGVIVELVWRLVAASCPQPKERRFPLPDSINQPGPDGVLDTDFPYEPFVPEGRSLWEIGTSLNARDKATRDYKDQVADIPEDIRLDSTFIFVTPLSGRRGWQYTRKRNGQGPWIEKRQQSKEWRDVRIIDGTKLIDWISQFPLIVQWMAEKMGYPAEDIESIEQVWNDLRAIGDPPPLMPQLFLANRDKACAKLKDSFSRIINQLKLDTRFPDQAVDFVSAYVASLDEESRIDIIGRCAVVSNASAWNTIVSQREPHFIVAGPYLDLSEPAGLKLLQKAHRAGHTVIYGAMPGGIPHPCCVAIPNPKIYQIKECLEKGGYTDERARILAQKSGGNLGSLLRCLQNLSLSPEWAERTPAAELAIALLLGSWNEKSEADCAIVEDLSGKACGEWIGEMREVALRPGAPLIQRDSVWKFISRYEGWYALGPRLFDEHLERLRKITVAVLKENDPKFELPSDERFVASIHGKVLLHSNWLRNGLAETLALLGSHPKALTSCSLGKPETTATLAVREILSGSDWLLWASLNDLLPLLAEAAPDEFLNAVEIAVNNDPSPFDKVFAQEDSGIMGWNYITGLLWALETLAWDAVYLTRVVVILGELAARDPGGNWANRPSNSLTTILLPWMPQTCAPIEKRIAAVTTLLDELPAVAWKLLLSILPTSSNQFSLGTRKPAWRGLISDDWSQGVTHKQYREQIVQYTELAIKTAKSDLSKLADLIDRLEDLPIPAFDQMIAYLSSQPILNLPESGRLGLWNELSDLIRKHRKFADTDWAMNQSQIDKLVEVANQLAPITPALRHQRLFSDRDLDLYDDKGNWDEQRRELEERRKNAIEQIYTDNGVHAILDFAKAVESSWLAGIALGFVDDSDIDPILLPSLIDSDQKSLAQFAGGFIRGRFNSRGWPWVDHTDTSHWLPDQIGQFLAFLPFSPETWERSAQLLNKDQHPYWSKASANPYETDESLIVAIDHLIEYGRPQAAIRCLHKILHDKLPLDSTRAIRALLVFLTSSESSKSSMLSYEIGEIIKTLQQNPSVSPNDLFKIEWAYLPLLDRDTGTSPKLLERMLADRPEFFCEVIRFIYRSKKDENQIELTEAIKNKASNAYRLLNGWRITPGFQEDGSFDGEALIAWVDAVKKECTETGHFDVAMPRIGYVLIHAPADPDGLWIHHSASAVLNAKDAGEIRDGFRSGLFNSRGVHTFTAGKEELKIATNYRLQADAVEAKGYHRLAASIRELATSYEREAGQNASRDPFDD